MVESVVATAAPKISSAPWSTFSPSPSPSAIRPTPRKDANVPIQTLFLDYPSKTFRFGPVVRATDDPDADMLKIRALFTPYRGKHRNAND